MDDRVLSLLCDPATHERLEILREPSPHGGEQVLLVNPRSGRRFPICEGIPCFLDPSEVSGLNWKYQKFYDRIAPGYDAAAKVYSFFAGQSLLRMRQGFLEEIEVKETGRVLEVSVGTGLNIPFLPQTVEFYGLDISWGMLRKCRRNLKSWRREAHLSLGAAEELPFQDEVFDVVFHFGGINFFTDRSRAISEMIRVAKPGTKIVISDETEKHVKSQYEKVPLAGKYFQNRKETVRAPIELVPASMLDVRLKEFRAGRIYCLTFRKPEVENQPVPRPVLKVGLGACLLSGGWAGAVTSGDFRRIDVCYPTCSRYPRHRRNSTNTLTPPRRHRPPRPPQGYFLLIPMHSVFSLRCASPAIVSNRLKVNGLEWDNAPHIRFRVSSSPRNLPIIRLN